MAVTKGPNPVTNRCSRDANAEIGGAYRRLAESLGDTRINQARRSRKCTCLSFTAAIPAHGLGVGALIYCASP